MLATTVALAVSGLALVLAGLETRRVSRALARVSDRLGALEARQARLQGLIERGWKDSMDLTGYDWRDRSSEPPKG